MSIVACGIIPSTVSVIILFSIAGAVTPPRCHLPWRPDPERVQASKPTRRQWLLAT